MSLADQLKAVKDTLPPDNKVTLVAVSKTHAAPKILEIYNAGQRHFGENKVQELCEKAEILPADIQWHLIGHLQSNKVKYIAPFIYLIHSVDSLKLLKEINKQGAKAGRAIHCLLQIYIATEESKFGMDEAECRELLESEACKGMKNIKIRGLMGMATNTGDERKIKAEFAGLEKFFQQIKQEYFTGDEAFDTLSMGMSSDFALAIREGSNMVRVGSLIFGDRHYA